MAINTPNASYNEMAKKWERSSDLYEGLQRLRLKSNIYLPKELEETDQNYQQRVNRSVLFNVYRRTIQALVGYAFSSAVTVSGAPPQLEYLEYNFDGTGRSITEVAAEIFHDSIHFGKAHVYVDFPSTKDLPEDLSLPEYEQMNLRPFVIPVCPRSVIGWRVEYDNGIETLKNIRLREVVREEDENFEESTVEYIRLITPDQITTYKATVDDSDFDIIDVSENTLNKIPLLTVYSNKLAALVSEPLLADLVELNINHFQSVSTQANALHFSRLPILLATGFADDADQLVIASNTIVMNSDPAASLKFVELNGQSISSARLFNQDLEGYMSKSGSEILFTKSVARQTASARQTDQVEALSIVQVILRSIEQSLEKAYSLAGEWLGLENVDVSIAIGSDLQLVSDPNPTNALVELQKLFQLNDEQLVDEGKRRGILAPHIKPTDVNINNVQEQPSNAPVATSDEDSLDEENPDKDTQQ